MVKKILLVSFFILVVVLSACQKSTNTTSKLGFIGGKEGLVTVMNVESGKNGEVLDNNLEDFKINLNLENKGEYPVKENEVLATIVGVDYRSFSLTAPSQKNVEPLDKIRQEQGNKVPGGQAVLSFASKFVDDLPVDQSYNLGANICYKYQTGATSSLCLRKEATKRGDPKDNCKLDDPKPAVGSSAAPLQVTSLSQRPTGKNEMSFTMTIENVGKGDVYPPDFVETNTQCLEKSDVKNKLQISVSFPENRPAISCPALGNSNLGQLQLIQGKATVTCKIDTSQEQETTFTRSPNIQLDYVYKDVVSTKLTVRNAA